jgi:hypothetical protein
LTSRVAGVGLPSVQKEQARKLHAHVALGIEHPDPGLLEMTARLFGGRAGIQQEVRALSHALRIIDEMAGGGIREALACTVDQRLAEARGVRKRKVVHAAVGSG